MSPPEQKEFFRRDRQEGITAPNLLGDSSIIEHIVHARGKHPTRYTSISDSPQRLHWLDDAPQLWRLLQPSVREDGHRIIHHEEVRQEIARVLQNPDDPALQRRAMQARMRAERSKEALISWDGFAQRIARLARRDVDRFAYTYVQEYFVKE